jgi:subtilisin family serine protease
LIQSLAIFSIVFLFSISIVVNADFAQAASDDPLTKFMEYRIQHGKDTARMDMQDNRSIDNSVSSQMYVPDRLLVKFNDDIPAHQKHGILNENNAVIANEIEQIDVLIINVPEQSLETVESALANNPSVDYVERDWLLMPEVIPNDTLFQNQWHLTKIGADLAWDTTKGDSAPIAILDTGIDESHEDLAAKLQNGWNFFNNNDNLADSCGHGTKVAGSAAAITNNGVGVAGVAWNNPIIPIKITDPNCLGYYSAMIQGITYAADNGAKVANISFRVFNGDAFNSAAQYMHSSGGWVVVAGGNTGNFENYSDNQYVISVAATSSSDATASFSSYGPYIDFAAPGSGIYTTRTNNSYGSSSGTSFASPITAGAIALVFAFDSTLSPDDVYNKLKNTAVDLGNSGRDDKYGWGRINVAAALADVTPTVDDVLPTVAITNPADNSDVAGVITVSVDASDNVQVDTVELYINGVLSQQDTSSPYDFTVDSAALNSGANQIEARAVDSSNNESSDQITVNVPVEEDTTAPTVTITNPADNSDVSGTISVDIDSSDNIQVAKVELLIDGVIYQEDSSSPYSFSLDVDSLGPGNHTIESVSYDSSNNNASDLISVNVLVEDTTAPTVAITNPTDDQTISGKTKIIVLASDDSEISKVEIFIDGTLKSTLTGNTYEYNWNPKGASSGIHTISSIATDNYGNSAQTSIDVIIEKGGDKNGKGGGKPQGKK